MTVYLLSRLSEINTSGPISVECDVLSVHNSKTEAVLKARALQPDWQLRRGCDDRRTMILEQDSDASDYYTIEDWEIE